jgi:hypothetical protein
MNSYPQKLSTGLWAYRHTALTSTYIVSLDKGVYAETYKPGQILVHSQENDCSYSFSLKDKKREKKKKRNHLIIVAALIVAMNGNTYAYGVEQIDYLKLYAHSRIINYKQFQCFNQLITKESNWRINAVNGSHYGLGQMRNPKYRDLDGYRQIDWTIRYIKGRYGSMCNSWRFFEKHGYH